MRNKRVVEVFGAGCSVCDKTVQLVERLSCGSCDVHFLDMNNPEVADRAQVLGIASVPAVVIDGKLASCCRKNGPTEETLREAGVGQPLV